MNSKQYLYDNSVNSLLVRPDRARPEEAVLIGPGAIGPDIGCYLKRAILEIEKPEFKK